MTDGVPEAQDAAGALYGHGRAERTIVDLVHGNASARDLVSALQADVLAFADGAEPHDDLTILALSWKGPSRTQAPPASEGG
jgi:serine phosphatase RsbU (regulator of sigma subunit)